MKKSIIALMGLFTLFACSDEVIQDMDKQSENPEIPMSVYTSDPNIPYDSPYDYNGSWNTLMYINNSTTLTIKLIPYFGSSFFDGIADDGLLHGYDSGSHVPNLYPLGSSEYGHSVSSEEYTIPPLNSYVLTGHRFDKTTPAWPNFDMSTLPFIGTSFDHDYLTEMCKLYYFEYEVYNSNNDHIFSGTLKQKFGDDNLELSEVLNVGGWGYIGDLVNNPALALVSNEKTSEICLVGHRKEVMPSEETFNDPSTDTMHTIKFYTDANGVYIDVN